MFPQPSETVYGVVKYLLFSVVVILLAVLGYFYYEFNYRNPISDIAEDEITLREGEQTIAYRDSLIHGKPEKLQNALVQDLRSGLSDEQTKSAAYFITHRYFDNGGNIYEIFDYVEAHPELSFLKEAELMYPSTFKKIRDRSIPEFSNNYSLYAILAYMEVLDRYNLADMAALGTIANQHAFLAYKRTLAQNPNATDLSQLLDETAKRDVQKAIEYLNKTAPFIDSVLLGEDATQDIPERDVLVGLNQYASATAYLYTLKVNSFSKNTYVNIFPVALSYSERYVPELHAFTALSYATALNISNTGSVDDFEFALRPITSFNIASAKSGSVIWKIINSKNNTSISAYGGPNIKGIAAKSPSFKDWLVSAGWTEEDFK